MSESTKNTLAHIALGSNIEPKIGHLKQAIDSVGQINNTHVVGKSQVYQTVPVGYANQDDFMNMVISVETTLDEHDFLHKLQEIEHNLKRVRTIKNGPRTIDLDVILLEDQKIQTSELEVPHPRMHERAFVLFPLAELAGNALVPTQDKTVNELKEQLPEKDKSDVFIVGNIDELATN